MTMIVNNGNNGNDNPTPNQPNQHKPIPRPYPKPVYTRAGVTKGGYVSLTNTARGVACPNTVINPLTGEEISGNDRYRAYEKALREFVKKHGISALSKEDLRYYSALSVIE